MHVLVVFDHPYGAEAHENVPHRRSLAAAALEAVRTGLADAGHSVDVVDLVAEGFDPVMSATELRAWRTGGEMRSDATALQHRLSAADHLVFVFPVWWMAMPAGTKGFLDRVLSKGYAFDEPTIGGALRGRLTRLRAVSVVSVMTTDAALYRWWFGRPATAILGRGTFRLIGIRRFRHISIGRSTQRGAAGRARALAGVRRRFAAL
ncbi:putative NADPH-quinone reductase [Microterricola gilva]|uniref:Putative NADPH-quinone reductase n=1 Tax=Microterricola gilva TaxID=393267 RepID=A0A4V2GB62_9MICO|nr:NAD(P)H-dependent oxidoreductase [Microterricola gilva]RZU66936.1 putative NADPH-quinone reductase [Microterricola gilva]